MLVHSHNPRDNTLNILKLIAQNKMLSKAVLIRFAPQRLSLLSAKNLIFPLEFYRT
jgi:hypothetical protein